MTPEIQTLVDELRSNAGWRNERHETVTDPTRLRQAADLITRLAGALKEIDKIIYDDGRPNDPFIDRIWVIARQALTGRVGD